MTKQNNKELMQHVFDEVWNKGNLDVLDEAIGPNEIFHVAGWGDARGPREFREFASMMRSAFPDMKISIDEQVAEGDQLATRWTWHGTHRGEFLGVEPTNQRVTVTGITFGRVADDKRGETWIEGDTFGLLRQLGAIPETIGAHG